MVFDLYERILIFAPSCLQTLHILYSGSIPGTSIAKNAIIGSNHRGIVIEGSSNISIYDNIAVTVSGHAFYVGDQSHNNFFERNLGSQTKTISKYITLYDENDYDAAAFFSRCPPNNFVSNVASGNMEHGFYFTNWYTRSEVNIILCFPYRSFIVLRYAQPTGISLVSGCVGICLQINHGSVQK